MTNTDLIKRHPHVYEMLKTAGHAPSIALEIMLDAKRGVSHAIRWVRTLHGGRQFAVRSERAGKIEKIVRDDYCGECDAADIALDELRQDPHRSDEEIAVQVATRIAYP